MGEDKCISRWHMIRAVGVPRKKSGSTGNISASCSFFLLLSCLLKTFLSFKTGTAWQLVLTSARTPVL